MRFFISLAVFVCSLLTTASAARDYAYEIHIVNENAANNVCTNAEYDDLYDRFIPTITSVLADPKYDLTARSASEWKRSRSGATANRKERDLQAICATQSCINNYTMCVQAYACPPKRRVLRSERELSDAEVLEIKTNTEGAVRGLLNKFANTSFYSKDCTKALIGATIGSSMAIIG